VCLRAFDILLYENKKGTGDLNITRARKISVSNWTLFLVLLPARKFKFRAKGFCTPTL
jgi:hypothetical protein